MELEEKLREAACNGDLEQLTKLSGNDSVNVNSQNKMNGWTALHWAAKRNHVAAVRFLLEHGADKSIKNNNDQLPAQLTSMEEIQNILGYEGQQAPQEPLAITPNYISHPVFPYASGEFRNGVPESPRVPGTSQSTSHTPVTSVTSQIQDSQELVLKARVAYTDERDFIEVELDRNNLTFSALVSLLTRELAIDRKSIYKIRKLPNTILRKDKDVRRLCDFQELEVVLTNKASSVAVKGHGDFSEGYKTERILY